jgi:hypothetical protein
VVDVVTEKLDAIEIKQAASEVPCDRDNVEDLLALLYGQYFASRTKEWCKVFNCGIMVTKGMPRYLDQMVHRSVRKINSGQCVYAVVIEALTEISKKINHSILSKDVEWARRLKKCPRTIANLPNVGIDLGAIWLNIVSSE